MKACVVYYSRAGENYFGGTKRYVSIGNTEKVARKIAEKTGADLFKLEQEVPYSDVYDECLIQSKEDQTKNARPKLLNAALDLSDYDTIFLGYPNYWGSMPMAVYTFLEDNDLRFKKIRPFCTHEGSGLSSTPEKIQKMLPEASVTKGLAILGSQVDHVDKEIERWLNNEL